MWRDVWNAVRTGGVSLSYALEWLERSRKAHEVVLEAGLVVEDARDVGTVWRVCDVGRYVRAMECVLRDEVGVEVGERVLVCTSNGVEMMWVSLALMRLGAVVVPVNWRCSVGEVEFMVEDSGARVVLMDEVVWGRVGDVECGVVGLLAGTVGFSREARGAFDVGRVVLCSVEGCLERVRREGPRAVLGLDEVCAIFYTSGTTGVPKGAMLTSRSILGPTSALFALPVQWFGRSMFAALPLAHIMGFVAVLLGIVSGVCVVFRERFDPVASLDVIESGRVTSVLAVPSMYKMWLANGARERDWSRVEVFASAADVMPGDLIDTFKNMGQIRISKGVRSPAVFVELYGSVELSGAAMLRVSVPFVRAAQGGFVGWPLPGFRVKVLSPKGGVLRRGESGVLWVRGPGVLRGYLGWEEREGGCVVDEEGWLNTGDLAVKTRLGLVRFVGREKHVIKSGGFSVFPAEVESKLEALDGVLCGVVVGMPDGVKGERVVAAVVLEEGSCWTQEGLREELGRQVAWYKAPREIVFMGQDEIPYGPTGKVVKKVLRERLGDLLK